MMTQNYSAFYHVMPDGTVKQINPFSGTEVWAVPGRGNKPLLNEPVLNAKKIEKKDREDYCDFCQTFYYKTPPEKSRLIKKDGKYVHLYHLAPDQFDNSVAEFRRTGNMFEIVTIDYWKKNYNYRLTKASAAWRDDYISNSKGAEHINSIINFKLKRAGLTEDQILRKSQFDKLQMADAFFGGCHELIIARQHFIQNAEYDTQLCSSGEMTKEEHYQYFKFTIDAMRDMLEHNRYIRYVTVFQNWLRLAGASVDHLHKQLVGLDEWGASVTSKIQMVRQDPNVFNHLGANFAAQYNLVFAENDYAIAFIGIGHRYPTIEIYSRSYYTRPYELTEEELRGFSDLVHACHAAMGSQVSCNEEWHYTPVDSVYKIPWHINLNWRINVPAGFEGGTGIFINPLTPTDLRDKIVPNLYQLRNSGYIENVVIAEECKLTPNPLKYYIR